MNWNEPILLERRYKVGSDQATVVARLGFPRPAERGQKWGCAFQLDGWQEGRVRVAHGEDGLQALTIAATAIRRLLDEAGNVTSSDEAPYEIVFPRYVPFCHGLDYHRNLCRVLDAEIDKKEQEIHRRFGQ
jgi:hypothetical protein